MARSSHELGTQSTAGASKPKNTTERYRPIQMNKAATDLASSAAEQSAGPTRMHHQIGGDVGPRCGENQKGWLDIVGICVVLLLVSTWQRWRRE